ncbi:MAG: 2,3-epoxybenzoyl-CoA dihydrolase [Dehalococcoidia bacterium]
MGTAPDPRVEFRTRPSAYRHWRLAVEGHVARLVLDVDEQGSLFEGVLLKLNSYDLGVDIELADAVTRLRFEHPGVRLVLLESGKERVFCAGANIRMLATASHRHKVNFCKFTNETRNAIEDATAAGQRYVSIIQGTAAGGGYELALATDWIVLAGDGSSAVSLPELPLLAVLPGTGGLTRLVDKRHVRRDLADVFCTLEEGVKGERALTWKLVDEVVPKSRMAEARERLATGASAALGPAPVPVPLPDLARTDSSHGWHYSTVRVELDDARRVAALTIQGPEACLAGIGQLQAEGAAAWSIRAARELDDAILNIRFNEPTVGVIVLKTSGDPAPLAALDDVLAANPADWLALEVRALWTRVLRRLDLTAASLVAVIEPGSCFVGTLAELAFAADRSYMLDGELPGVPGSATLTLTAANFGWYPAANGAARLATRFNGQADDLAAAAATTGRTLEAAAAAELGLVTFAVEAIDWDDDLRLYEEERLSFSPDALTAMEANLRFAGAESMETKILGRLTAWQNWVFQRPNAVGPEGALQRYGTGQKPRFDIERI